MPGRRKPDAAAGDPPSRTRLDRYFDYVDWLTENPKPKVFSSPSTKPGLADVASAEYPDLPGPGLTSVFTYGLSLAENPHWQEVTPELLLVVRAADTGPWAQVTADLAEHFRGEAPFSWGETFMWDRPIDPASSMRSFLAAPAAWDMPDDVFPRVDVGEQRPIVIVGLYPIHESEMWWIDANGWRAFFGLEWDMFDVTRPAAA